MQPSHLFALISCSLDQIISTFIESSSSASVALLWEFHSCSIRSLYQRSEFTAYLPRICSCYLSTLFEPKNYKLDTAKLHTECRTKDIKMLTSEAEFWNTSIADYKERDTWVLFCGIIHCLFLSTHIWPRVWQRHLLEWEYLMYARSSICCLLFYTSCSWMLDMVVFCFSRTSQPRRPLQILLSSTLERASIW